MRQVAYLIVSLLLVASLLASWREEIPLFFNSEGYEPSLGQSLVAIACSIAVVGSTVLLALNFDSVKKDYATYKAGLRNEQPPPAGTAGPDSLKDAVAQNLEEHGYRYHSSLVVGVDVWVSDKQRRDGNLLLRKNGVVLYENGTTTQFSVAVLAQDDSWKLNDPVLVHRQSMGRAVSIRTVVRRPILRELLASNDYVIGVGLASHDSDERTAENEDLSRKRAYNTALALLQLHILGPDRIRGVSLGECTEATDNPLHLARQRSVVIIGVNASRDVIVNDVIGASAAIVDVQGLNLRNYHRRLVWNQIDPKSPFKTLDDKLSLPTAKQPAVLPAVPQHKAGERSGQKK